MPAPLVLQQNGAAHGSLTSSTTEHVTSQWLFTPTELLKSPSILEGMPVEQELANRQKGVSFITQVGVMLKLPQLTLATASVFLHRFYMRYPMQVSKDKGIHHYQVAATALFLATKVEENCRKMKELIVACCRVAQKNPNSLIDEQSKEYWKWRDTILYHEDLLLEALCFDLQLEQPYRMLFDFLCYYGIQENKNLRNTSWAFLNDSHVTTMCLLHSPRAIAGSALYAGVKLAGITIPDDDSGRPWWEQLELDILEIQKACNQMADVYENPNVPRQGQKDAYAKDEDVMSFERTRRTQSPSFENSPARSTRSTSQGIKREREDSWGHEGKNGHSDAATSLRSAAAQANPSPKRLRTDSGPPDAGSDVGSQQRTSGTGSRVPENALGNTGPQPTSLTVPGRAPPIANGHTDEVQQRIDDIVNASSSSSHSSRVPRSQSRLEQSVARNQSQQGVNDNNEPIPSASNPSSRLPPTIAPNNQRSALAQNSQPDYSRANDIADTTEEVDYGSEEGEV